MIDREPIKDFRDEKELNACLREWQKILYLEDWVIGASLVSHEELQVSSGEDLQGRNLFDVVNKAAHIYIAKSDENVSSRVVKYCAEQTLVHELLHCKHNWLSPPDTIEGRYFDTLEHQLLDETARAFILARYNITKDWFSNIDNY